MDYESDVQYCPQCEKTYSSNISTVYSSYMTMNYQRFRSCVA